MSSQKTLNEQVLTGRACGALSRLGDFSLIELQGKDACSYVHGRVSSDVNSLESGQGQYSAFLDRKGYLLAYASVYKLDKALFILSIPSQSGKILSELSTYHFREDLHFQEKSESYKLYALLGPRAQEILSEPELNLLGNEEHSIAKCKLFGQELIAIRRSLSGDFGLLLFLPLEKTNPQEFESSLSDWSDKHKVQQISQEALSVLVLEAGLPEFGKDISSDYLLPETGLEQVAASYSKGCFQGQEVLARIKTYGAPRRALVGLELEESPASVIALDTAFSINGEEGGCIKSNAFSPTLQKYICLAYINREFRLPDKELEIELPDLGKFKAKVRFLPFYTREENLAKARTLYDEALQEFAHGSEKKAVGMLREVIELDPQFTDAYESLGVILSRQEEYDEAIALMHRLQALDPDSIMAHTNLSVYYMQIGDKEKAEEEKAISMSLRMSQLAREHAQKKADEESRKKDRQEAEKRLSMFRQVLEIDPDDFLANNGVGTVYVELGLYEEAIPYLKKAIEVKATHTVAYLALGRALSELSRLDQAKQVYEQGIEIAARRGDITPMKEMQALLAALQVKAR